MTKVCQIGLFGLGTVGTGTARILLDQAELLARRAGSRLELARVCDRHPDDLRGLPLDPGRVTADVRDLLDDPAIRVFVELIGGIEPARSVVLQAIAAGKHVVTANKALLAEHGSEIFAAAAEAGVAVGFEASVGGGIPVIKTLKEGLVANRIETVAGIMNGTANYVLTRMTDDGLAFDEALAEAQRLGYAEADPTFDVDGIDTAHKLAILAALAFATPVGPADIATEGISRLTPLDITFAAEFGYRIKLLAIARHRPEGLELRVHPTMIPADHLLARVEGAANAFYLVGDAVGQVLLHGPGAGQMPTGSAVVADIVDIARGIAAGVPPCGGPFEALAPVPLRPMEALVCRYYFRFSAKDRPGVLARIAGILGDNGISIAAVIQKGRRSRAAVPIVMLTHEAEEARVRRALARIDELDVVTDPTTVIRIEDPATLAASANAEVTPA
ncbi:homoserine dehydrogenase [Dissulfurirhabdus thermomarina]|uniref:Homoserine dehydrogenase n=1 Tax=Dissulfurirhabdus thermomarina TaxID=1765737 RepID=A0A6N9TLC0_DISTH|nr:homoserine dehydrogenase [Dissulfurirhabdus thermomarina]NDY41848.1 homoserine dehydrogenase [Dissulfurirhabdus thermomarina]NMX22996.1 homoserine dehydrogenase [Dissulfurirhabdus thermomarina]